MTLLALAKAAENRNITTESPDAGAQIYDKALRMSRMQITTLVKE
jgi:hypothetical protein